MLNKILNQILGQKDCMVCNFQEDFTFAQEVNEKVAGMMGLGERFSIAREGCLERIGDTHGETVKGTCQNFFETGFVQGAMAMAHANGASKEDLINLYNGHIRGMGFTVGFEGEEEN